MTIGDKIKKARRQAKLSRAELAWFVGVDVSTVCRWENDAKSVSFDRLWAIARVCKKRLVVEFRK